MEWNGYTFTAFQIDTNVHTWILRGILENNDVINIMVLGIASSYVGLTGDNGVTFYCGGVLQFSIPDISALSIIVNVTDITDRNSLLEALNDAWQ